MVLVTAGNDIKLWCTDQLPNIQETYSFNPHKEIVKQVFWGDNNNLLASISTNGTSVAIQRFPENSSNNLSLSSISTCIGTHPSSPHLITGDVDGCLNLYDLKRMKLKRNYISVQSELTSVLICGTYVAGGYKTGDIVFFNVATSDPYLPVEQSKKSNVLWMATNKSIIASCHANGSVSLFDVRKQYNTCNFNCHSSPVKCATFSPVDDRLLISCGLDSSIICYTVAETRSIHKIQCTLPLASVSLASDGYTVFSGSTTGCLLIHDLRNTSVPLGQVDGVHSGCVNSVSSNNFLNDKSTFGNFSLDSMCNVTDYLPEVVNKTNSSRDEQPIPGKQNYLEDSLEIDISAPSIENPTSPKTFDLSNISSSINGSSIFQTDMNGSSTPAIPTIVTESSGINHLKRNTKVTFEHNKNESTNSAYLVELEHEASSNTVLNKKPSVAPNVYQADNDIRCSSVQLQKMIRYEIETATNKLYAQIVGELMLSERSIIKEVKELFDEKKALSLENEQLRQENKRLKKNF